MKQIIKKHLINSRGSRLKAKLVVFESDDWGSIRIPSTEIRAQLLEKMLIKEKDAFSRFDSLETTEDYHALYEVLSKFKDQLGVHPVITANVIMNNPDFKRIRQSDFTEYYKESFQTTYENYEGSNGGFTAMQEGIEKKFLVPQLHGDEHLNVSRWMKFLQDRNERYHFAFDRKCFSIDEISSENRRGNLMAAYDHDNKTELDYIIKSISDGANLFESTFGFKSETTIAPCYVWDNNVEKVFSAIGVKGLQGSFVQNIPVQGKDFDKKYRYSGQENNLGQHYYIRNALFEPSVIPNVDWVNKCLESISIAFKWGKPAIIGTHRINFCSRLDKRQRDQNLTNLEELLKQMLVKWPDLEFKDSSQLGLYY